jgi:dihydrofolate synthase/folylpolyglutamate synthase
MLIKRLIKITEENVFFNISLDEGNLGYADEQDCQVWKQVIESPLIRFKSEGSMARQEVSEWNYEQWVRYIYGLVTRGIKYDLVKISILLNKLCIEKEFPLVVHVLGTNGKGSVASMTASGLSASGWKTGLFTSPHLTRILERFRIDGEEIDENLFCSGMVELYPHIECMGSDPEMGYPSFFEIMTALGLVVFRMAGCGAIVLEAGLGGRLDATNGCRTHITVITNVDYDHVKTLGPTLKAIAGEKAGAMRRGIPVVSNDPRPYVRRILRRLAEDCGTSIHFAGSRVSPDSGIPQSVRVSGYESLGKLKMNLLGEHQMENGSTAVSVLETLASLKYDIDLERAVPGILQAQWPGRLEWISRNPDILLDGAHNLSGARALSLFLAELVKKYRHVNCLMGVLGDKDVSGVFSEILPHADRVVLCRPPNWRAQDPEMNLDLARTITSDSRVISDPVKAYEYLLSRTSDRDLLIVCGSLYLVGEVRGHALRIAPDPCKVSR